MNKKRILIIDDDARTRAALKDALEARGYKVDAKRTDARRNNAKYDLIVSSAHQNGGGARAKFFQLKTARFAARDEDQNELRRGIEQIIGAKLRVESATDSTNEAADEHLEFELPSDIALMPSVLDFIIARAAAHNLAEPGDMHLFIALDEAFVNAVKHGNKNDVAKLVRVAVDLNNEEARFTIEDEGEGFDLRQVPDPRAAENLFKTSGRGVLLMQNIMDEVRYNARGNQLTMVKRKP
jgi:serine/threonine-protein kinase RsbW